MLTRIDEYEGGGTYFRSLRKTIKLQQGQVLVHPGETILSRFSDLFSSRLHFTTWFHIIVDLGELYHLVGYAQIRLHLSYHPCFLTIINSINQRVVILPTASDASSSASRTGWTPRFSTTANRTKIILATGTMFSCIRFTPPSNTHAPLLGLYRAYVGVLVTFPSDTETHCSWCGGPPGWQCRHAKTIVYSLDCVKKILPSLYSTCRSAPSGLLTNISYVSELSTGGVFLRSFLPLLFCFGISGWQEQNSMKHLLPSSPLMISMLSRGGACWWWHPTRLCPIVPRSSSPRETRYSPEFYQCCRFHCYSGTNACIFDIVTAIPCSAYLHDEMTCYQCDNPMHNHRQWFRYSRLPYHQCRTNWTHMQMPSDWEEMRWMPLRMP